MSAIRPPAFQFYPKDFLSDAKQAALSATGAGIYIRLICHCWLEGSLPSALGALARLSSVSVGTLRREWPLVEPCFELKDDRYVHPRLVKERKKQIAYQKLQQEKGLAGANKRWQRPSSGHPPAIAQAQPKHGSAVCSLPSAVSDLQRKEEPTARSKRPIFTGQRFTVFEWQLDDLRRMLGPHMEAFDVHAWFFDLDAAAARSQQVIPVRDGGKWLQAQCLAEAQRRGLSIDTGKPRKQTPEEEAAEILAEVRRQDARVAQ